jgi:DNA-binding GntR family transcriptional regulator
MQALLRLEAEGFVRPAKRKGWQIAALTVQGVNDVLDAYRWTAPSLGVLVARNASDEQIASFGELVRAWPGDGRRARPNFAPIRFFAAICGNPVMADMTRVLSAQVERIFSFITNQRQELDEAFFAARDAALEALIARDEEQIPKLMTALVDASEAEINRILQRTKCVQTVPLQIEHAS